MCRARKPKAHDQNRPHHRYRKMNRHSNILTKAMAAAMLVVLPATPVQVLALLVAALAVAQVVQLQVAAQQAVNQVGQALLAAAAI